MPSISEISIGVVSIEPRLVVRTKKRVLAAARIRSVVRRLWIHFLKASGCLWWAKRSLRRRGATVVLALHRVLDDFNFARTGSLPGIVLREETFRNLVKYVSERHKAVSISDVVPGSACKKLRMVFTFDDGWSDNLKSALPIARAYRIPFIVFVCPGLTGRKAPFWQEQVIANLRSSSRPIAPAEINRIIEDLKRSREDERELRIAEVMQKYGAPAGSAELFGGDSTLSLTEIVAMHGEGVAFGSHTQTHQILTCTTPNVVRKEVRESKIAIEIALGGPCRVFAYPNGNWSPEVKQILGEEGMRLALTTETGAWTADSDPLAIPRVNVSESTVVDRNGDFSRTMFDYSTIWKAWRGTKRQ